jgi:hypothetical protein
MLGDQRFKIDADWRPVNHAPLTRRHDPIRAMRSAQNQRR